ncbi:MAG: MotA/TolQ/ExbB proton channel family protein [Bdellovibrionales bacterium]|nr:MotA/TolQ/ExbB proton channel family protein [Bdellovibrionales bacterium]
MNKSSMLGIVAAVVVFLASILTATDQWAIFLDPHGILIVIGGTLAASMICFPVKTVIGMVKVVFYRILGKNKMAVKNTIEEIVELSKGQRTNPKHLVENVDNIENPFLKEAIQLMNMGGLSPQQMDRILNKRAFVISKRHSKEAGIFKTMGKFPPAFGLMGTTLGMVALLQKLGSPESYKALGPAMAIGLIATLYGIAVTNLILIPMGENLTKANEEDDLVRQVILDGVKLLREGAHPLIVEEDLKSYLLPKERNEEFQQQNAA